MSTLQTTNGSSLSVVGTTDMTSVMQQFIAFRIDNEEYGIDILSIWEIKGWLPVRALPNAPTYVRGVVDLRGIIVPICDLHMRFGGHETEITRTHVIIIVKTASHIYGILVDEISDIISVAKDQIRAIPQIDAMESAAYLQGLVTINDRMVTLLNVDCLFATVPAGNDLLVVA